MTSPSESRTATPRWGLLTILGHFSSGSGMMPPDTLFAAVDFNRLPPTWPPNQPVLRGDLRAVVLDSLQYILGRGGTEEELYHLGRDSWQVRNLMPLPDFAGPLQQHRAAISPILPRPTDTPP
ncbi:MAG TPA: hypothetical protein VLL51_00955 [Gemmatimonadales bacterium]|nr:hypothetical protein [Gemmatimonadales bacterium]